MDHPESKLIDAHVHQWDFSQCDYPWLDAPGLPEAFGALRRNFRIEQVAGEMEAAGVTGMVLVQASDSRCDTRSMLAAAAAAEKVLGVVGWVNLLDAGAVPGALDELTAAGPVVGIRHMIYDEPDPIWVLQPRVAESLGVLADRGVAFDFVGTELDHLRAVPPLAAAVPSLRIVIDHLNKPPVGTGRYSEWVELIRAAAQCPNVCAKISGLHNISPRPDWDASDLREPFEAAVAAFGSSRLMYGGDWPVCNVGGGYTRQFEAFDALRSELGAEARQDLSWRTAETVYGLARLNPMPPP